MVQVSWMASPGSSDGKGGPAGSARVSAASGHCPSLPQLFDRPVQVYNESLSYLSREWHAPSALSVPLAGGAAGFFLSIILSPAELVKVVVQGVDAECWQLRTSASP